MKNLHFYIQCLMLILALSVGVLIPFDYQFAMDAILIQLLLGSYQLMMSCLFMRKLKKPSRLLSIHFYGSWAYITALVVLGSTSPSWLDKTLTNIGLFGIPWVIAIYFLVVMDDLERARNYRL